MTRDLISSAMESIERAVSGGEPDPVVLNLPDDLPRARGRTVEWEPLVALAVAGHICRYWSQGLGPRGPFEIEDGEAAAGWATLRSPGNGRLVSRRLQAGGGRWAEHGIRVVELCGHQGCGERAPAGPGSRCPQHFDDPSPAGGPGTHWAEIAARAWADRYGADGAEHPRRVDDRRASLVTAAVAAGMTEEDLAAAAGLRGDVVDEILRPRPRPQDDGDQYDGPL
ncbi:hypothetical protein [Kitasatospora sp. NPDC059327]|uniref:hypothetical protein n=1 Tax=Kitasatospora sp. NPDC059327 TaxID=3346803 RepID=UPI003693575D